MDKTDKNREIILSSARRLFSKFGFKKTTMDEIAADAGKGKSSLYYYYKSKEEVFAAVVEEEALHLQEKINLAVSKENSASTKLKAYIKTSIRTIQEMANLNEAIQNEFLRNYAFIDSIRKEYNEQEIKFVQEILQMGVQQEHFVLHDTYFTARVVVRVIKALEIPLRMDRPERNLGKEIDSIMQLILYGMVER